MYQKTALTAKQRGVLLKAAHYNTRVLRLTDPRCSNCRNVRRFSGAGNPTTYDRTCSLFQLTVKTHGHCAHHQKADS